MLLFVETIVYLNNASEEILLQNNYILKSTYRRDNGAPENTRNDYGRWKRGKALPSYI